MQVQVIQGTHPALLDTFAFTLIVVPLFLAGTAPPPDARDVDDAFRGLDVVCESVPASYPGNQVFTCVGMRNDYDAIREAVRKFKDKFSGAASLSTVGFWR